MSNEEQLQKAFEGSIANSLHLAQTINERVEAIAAQEPDWGLVGSFNEINVTLRHVLRSLNMVKKG